MSELDLVIRDASQLERVSVSEHFHQAGVNLRFIGHALRCATFAFYSLLPKRSQSSTLFLVHHLIFSFFVSERESYVILLIEAIARCLKNELRKQMREFSVKLKLPIVGQ
jgi:hypothetical protein